MAPHIQAMVDTNSGPTNHINISVPSWIFFTDELQSCQSVNLNIAKIRVIQKKVYHELDHPERCGFLHSVQHVAINTFETYLHIAKFLPFLLYIKEQKNFKILQMNQNQFYLINWASDMSKITLSVIVCARCLNKTTINT